MRVKLTINGVDFTQWLAEDGLKYSSVERTRREIVTLAHKKISKTVEKQQIEVTLLDMPDDELQLVEQAINLSRPAIVNYSGKNGIGYTGVICYISSPSANAHRVIGNTTEWTGISFTIEEQ